MHMLKLKVYNLSPIHIGTGNKLDPFTYILKEIDGKVVMVFYRFSEFMNMVEQATYSKIMMLLKSPSILNYLAVRKIISESFDINKHKSIILKCEVMEKTSFYSDYMKNINRDDLNGNRAINQLEIEEIYRNNFKAVIPGSSFKGAIRTAILQRVKDKQNGSYIEPKGDTDPFKILSVADINIPEGITTQIGYYLNFPLDNLEKKNSIPVVAESIKQGQTMSTEILLRNANFTNDDITNAIKDTIKDEVSLFNTINNHFKALFKHEYEVFYKVDDNEFVRLFNRKLGRKDNFYKPTDIDDLLQQGRFAVIKVGKHSGALGVTYKERSIKVRTKNGYETRSEPTTLWHFSYNKEVTKKILFPSGWLLLYPSK